MNLIETFQAAVAALLADYSAKETQIATLTAENAALQAQNAAMTARLAALASLIDQLSTLAHSPLS